MVAERPHAGRVGLKPSLQRPHLLDRRQTARALLRVRSTPVLATRSTPFSMRVGLCYNRYEDALGVKCVSWSPSGQLLSIGSYDEKLRILNHMTWKTLAEHDHTQTKVDGRSVDVYREHTFYDGETERTRYAVEDSMVVVPTETPDATKPFPKLGVGMQAWSSDSALLFTRNDNAPTALWIWETVRRAPELVRLCLYACSSSVFQF